MYEEVLSLPPLVVMYEEVLSLPPLVELGRVKFSETNPTMKFPYAE